MSSSIIRKDLPYNRRERRHEIGQQGEINVGKLLASVYGFRKVSYAFDNYSEGTNGYPDIVLKISPPIAIEVKSISPFTIRSVGDKKVKSVGYVGIKRSQWYEQLKFARERLAKLILIVECRLKDKCIYFWFDSDMIEEYMNKLDGERVHISFWDVLSKGNSIIYDDEIKYLEYWNHSKPVENESQIQIV